MTKNKTAKLNRTILFNFGNGKSNLTPSAVDFMVTVAPYIDLDGRININLHEVRKALYGQVVTLNRVIDELISLDHLYKKGVFYYSKFHVITDGKDESYQRLLEVFTSAAVLNMNKNRKRLFYYFASYAIVGYPKKISVENLYENTLHSDNQGINYYDSYQNLTTDLFALISEGLITLNVNGTLLSNLTTNFEEVFHNFCDFNQFKQKDDTSKYTVKKNRTSKNKLHKFTTSINQRCITNIVDNRASEQEILNYADRYNICSDLFRDETFAFMIAIKNELVSKFNETGLKLYRTSLNRYFKEHQEKVPFHQFVSGVNKVANYFMDFYLLPELKDILLAAAKCKSLGSGHMAAMGYPSALTHVNQLISYYLNHASDNHLVVFDQDLGQQELAWEKLTSFDWGSKTPWSTLHEEISSVYKRFVPIGIEISSHERETINECTRQWALKGLLTQKDHFDVMVQELYEKLLIIPTKRKKNDSKERAKHFAQTSYNWLRAD